jgi:hypothetical protein
MPQPDDDRAEPHREGQHQVNVPPRNRGEGREINGRESSVVDEGVFFNNLEAPEIRINTSHLSPMEAAQEIYLYLLKTGYLDSPVAD